MTTVLGRAGGVRPSRSSASRPPRAPAIQASSRRTLRKPGPATSGVPAIGDRSTAAASSAARSRGFFPADLASAMQPLAW